MDLSCFQVDIVAARMENSIFTEQLRKLGVSFYPLSGNRNRILENQRQFAALIKEKKYDVLHVNAFHAVSLSVLRLGRALGIPVRIAHAHCAGLNKGKFSRLKLLAHNFSKQLFSSYATELWACSRTAAAFMYPSARLIGDSCRIIPNGINVSRFRFCKECRHITRTGMGLDGNLVIGSVGRLCQEKNQVFLLDIFSEILKARSDSKLLLIGEGPERDHLIQRAKELCIESNTIFYGTTERIERLLWAMDLFVFPSLTEGLGLAAIEAQAAGLPVLCSDAIPSEARIIPSVQSLPLKESPARWASVLLNMQKNAGSRESCADAVRAKGYGIEDVADCIAAIYQKNEGQRA